MTDQELVCLTIASNNLEAHLIAALLEAEGILAHVAAENAMDEWGAVMRAFSARIEVPRFQLEKARQILEDKRDEIAAKRAADESPSE